MKSSLHKSKRISRKVGELILAGLLFFVNISCSNVFQQSAKKTTDEAYFEEARKAVDLTDYDAAISYFQLMSPTFLARTSVREAYAGALAGKCGLNFLEFVETLSSASLTGSTLFLYAMSAWQGKVVSPDYCLQAEQQIKAIWASESQTSSQKFFMAILGLAKMGTYLRSKVDQDGPDNLGDGSPDAVFDACDATDNGAANLDDDEVGEVLTGLMLFITYITDFATSVGGDLSGSTAVVDGLCAAMAGPPLNLPPEQIPCTYTDWTGVDPADKAAIVAVVRDMLATGPTSSNAANRLGVTSPVSSGNPGYEADGSCSLDPFVACCP